MPRRPNGKRVVSADGAVSVRAKNANGQGSVYFVESGGRRTSLPGIRNGASSKRECATW